MLSFHHRPFPPPSLTGVPVEYIIDQLHGLAPQYWDKPDTADCTIIVPIPHPGGILTQPSALSISDQTHTVTSLYSTSGPSRRATQPALNSSPRISLKLHIDYLAAHSSYLRGLFSGASPLDLMFSSSPPSSTKHPLFGNSSIPPDRLPRLMPCSPDHPILFLPVPDPTSFQLLIHWMYFGDLSFIENALRGGIIQWEGIARNVEYLDLSARIKLFLKGWYNSWLDPERECQTYDDDDSDTACSDYSSETDCSTPSDFEPFDLDDLKEPCRGRDRTTRPLSFQPMALPC